MRPTVRAVSKRYAYQVTLVVVDRSMTVGERRAEALKVRGHPVLLLQEEDGPDLCGSTGRPTTSESNGPLRG